MANSEVKELGSDFLRLKACIASIHILWRGNVKQYEDNQKALLNNSQWRRKVTR